MRNTHVILSKNIKLDKEYKNVLDIGAEKMLALMRTQNHIVYETSDCSIIRNRETTIQISAKFGDCLNANYLAFQNPDYSNKWFFGFITNVKYISENATELEYKLDSFTTFFEDLNIKACYIEREHVNHDGIGKHTFPEGLETGEYIVASSENIGIGDTCVVIASTWDAFKNEAIGSNEYNGLFSGITFFVFKDTDYSSPEPVYKYNSPAYFLQALDFQGKAESCQGVFLVPKKLVDYDNIKWDSPSEGLQYYFYKRLLPSENPFKFATYTTAKKYDNIDGYVPKNNKLFTAEYNFLGVDNNNGASNTLNYEDFSSEDVKIDVDGVICIGGSILATPLNYKGVSKNFSESLPAGKFPTCSWFSDTYINWLTQQSVNVNGTHLPISMISGGAQLLTAGLTANPVSATAGISQIGGSLLSMYQHSKVSPASKGNLNSGDVLTSLKQNDYTIYKKTIKREYAEKIDSYFSRVGYRICQTLVPNITGRKYFNYVQIGGNEKIGYGNVPVNYFDEINNAFISGVTIWHSHESLGDYNLDNTII